MATMRMAGSEAETILEAPPLWNSLKASSHRRWRKAEDWD
jgi:hypothetical protein